MNNEYYQERTMNREINGVTYYHRQIRYKVPPNKPKLSSASICKSSGILDYLKSVNCFGSHSFLPVQQKKPEFPFQPKTKTTSWILELSADPYIDSQGALITDSIEMDFNSFEAAEKYAMNIDDHTGQDGAPVRFKIRIYEKHAKAETEGESQAVQCETEIGEEAMNCCLDQATNNF